MNKVEKKIIDNKLYEDLTNYKFIVRDGLFYKYSNNSEDKMIDLDHISNKLEYDVYVLAKYLLYLEDGSYVGFATDNYRKYVTIYTLLKFAIKINWNEVIKKITLAYLDLKKNGFLYVDFHHKNILVNEDNLKIVDMDSVRSLDVVDKEDLVLSIWTLMDLIVEIYFYNDNIPTCYIFNHFMMQIKDEKILNKKVYDFLVSIANKEDTLLNELESVIDFIIEDFSDIEKHDKIKENLPELPKRYLRNFE